MGEILQSTRLGETVKLEVVVPLTTLQPWRGTHPLVTKIQAVFDRVEEARKNHDLESLIWPSAKPEDLDTHFVVASHEILPKPS